MKTIHKIAFLFAGLLIAASCGEKPEPQPNGEEEVKVDPVSLELTFILPSGIEKTKWEPGDKIVVHGEYAAEQVTVTLGAEDISKDGKTVKVTVDNLYPYKNYYCASKLYASWPAEAVSNLKHCFYYSGFKDTNRLLLAACNDAENKFKFMPLTSPISFSVSGDFDTYTFAGRKDAVVGYEYMQVKITDIEQNLNQYNEGPIYSITAPVKADGTTVHKIYVPGAVSFPEGYVIKFSKDDKVTYALTEKGEVVSEKVGAAVELGNITGKLEEFAAAIDPTSAVNLAAKAPANTYMVTAAGTYKFPAVKGNDSSNTLEVASVKVLWETWCNDQEVTPKSIIKNMMAEEGNVYFVVPENFHTGNALIAAYDDNDKVLWSWLIWVPETEPTVATFSYTTGCEIMSRNLGALIDTKPGEIADPRSFGLLYEWGRKDPFIGAKAAGSAEFATFAGSAMTTTSEPITMDQAIENPLLFVCVSGKDWMVQPQDRMLWGDQERSGTKTIHDPCPPGYRVAGRKRASFFSNDGSSITGWAYSAENYYFQLGDPVTTLPICGYINSDGVITPDYACVWNTHMDNDTQDVSYCQWVGEGASKKKGKQRAWGGSIRCETE